MQPGRSCPLHYRYSPQVLARAPDFNTDTLYVIGGIYGNVHCGVITRIATTPSANPTLYGTCIGGVYVDALTVNYDKLRWRNDFLRMWPRGSAAYESYHRRLTAGPDYCLARAVRL